MFSMYSNMFRRFNVFALACISFALSIAVVYADDYVRDKSPSAAAKAYFAAVPKDLPKRKIARNDVQKEVEGEAYYTEDGSISIPPKGMVSFKLAGRCMDPHLPAPAAGEPMQFVSAERLIPPPLRGMYEELMRRMSKGDSKVFACNPQHLVWAIRSAGTDSPFADNLSDAQIALLDECAGRRGAFQKYHEKTKKRNARKNRKNARASVGNTISVGGLSYDASELSGSNCAQRIESHISELTEMGKNSKTRTTSDFRYGEIAEELYSDVISDGALSFTTRIINVSERRQEFRASDFAAQVGNGNVNGGMRQRVTMGTPGEFVFVPRAAKDGVEIDRKITVEEADGEISPRVRGRMYRKRTASSGEKHTSTEREEVTTIKTKKEEHTIIEGIPPVPPVPPVPSVEPVVINTPIADDVSVRVISLEYDTKTRTGTLVIEIEKGSFQKATKYVRKNFSELVRKHYSKDANIPEDAELKIDSVAINDKDLCEVRFTAKL